MTKRSGEKQFKRVYDYLTFILIISNQMTLGRSKPVFYT